MAAAGPDALLALRNAVSSGDLTTSTKLLITPPPTSDADADADADAPSQAEETNDIAAATSVLITVPRAQTFSLSAPTRFISKDAPVDLRSILYAYQTKDVPIPDYISEAQAKGLSNLTFVEKLDLIAWLEGSADSEYIRPLEGDAAREAEGLAQAVPTAGASAGAMGREGRAGGVYKHERRLGDRNSVLRGIKPTDFSHVKKTAELMLRERSKKPGSSAPAKPSSAPSANGGIPTHPKKQARRPDPIILLSPSASSLLRMSNVKPFLADGVYAPPDANSGVGSLNHITRILPSIDANRPLRFILVEGPDRFKSDDWKHVVAVFTTGQAWQFKGYRWTEPSDLFAHVLGIYVGWKGDPLPNTVRSWGRGVRGVEVEKWVGNDQSRWRDREVVEKLWSEVEEHMRRRGWSRDSGPR